MNNKYGPSPKSMDFGEAIGSCLKKYFVFEGRAGRSEFWFFKLFCILVYIAFYIGGLFIAIKFFLTNEGAAKFFTSLPLIWTVVVIIPVLAVQARRLHDVGKSGWWLLLQFTVIGAIPLLIWFSSEGTSKGYAEPNKRKVSARDYGNTPKSYKADLTDELEELQELYEDGTLSEAQFKKAKNKLLK
tara:strand:+ start:182 stop:739 length:558 start_codon:yes stop_codon:yes gene_type:complete